MPRGSKPGERRGGRAKGTPNKDKAELLARFVEIAGQEPMEIIAQAAKNAFEQGELTAAAQIAKDALPYMYRKLAQIEHSGEMQHNFIARLPIVAGSTDEWLQQHKPR